jgi:hypothetical protein
MKNIKRYIFGKIKIFLDCILDYNGFKLYILNYNDFKTLPRR